jgi:hypothetical protein
LSSAIREDPTGEGVSLVAPVTIDVDGQIQLIDCDQPEPGRADEADRLRQSRLNDVMIMVEGNQHALETALAARLQRTALPEGFAGLSLSIDEKLPEFHIQITGRPDQTIQIPDTKPEREAFETEIATEILSAIQNRTASTKRARWRPSVTATLRSASGAPASSERVHSVWFKALLWLLASMILATAYLYLKGDQG